MNALNLQADVELADPHPEVLATKEDFDTCIANNKLVAVDFFATWCGPCVHIGPKFAAMMKDYPNVKFVKVDVDANKATAQAVGIQAMPTFHFYKDGQECSGWRMRGADENGLKRTLAAMNSGEEPPAFEASEKEKTVQEKIQKLPFPIICLIRLICCPFSLVILIICCPCICLGIMGAASGQQQQQAVGAGGPAVAVADSEHDPEGGQGESGEDAKADVAIGEIA